MITRKRPRRRIDLRALALDAPLPIQPTCKGMGLPWPTGVPSAAPKQTETLADMETDLFATDDFDCWPAMSDLNP